MLEFLPPGILCGRKENEGGKVIFPLRSGEKGDGRGKEAPDAPEAEGHSPWVKDPSHGCSVSV